MSKSNMHAYLNWTKERIEEMDAAVASLEKAASQVPAESKVKAEQLFTDLMRRRQEFQAKFKARAQAGEAVIEANRAQLEVQWRSFEGQVRTFFEAVGKQSEQHHATFQDVAAAQLRAWHEAADKLQNEASKIAAANRVEVEKAIKQMKANAAQAEAQFKRLRQAGGESWSALGEALAVSRKAFDRANQAACDAFERALPKGA